jgi:hypothetical protein
MHMPLSDLLNTIATLTTQLTLLATALFGLSWVIGSALAGSPLPFRDWKEFGKGLRTDAIKAAFELMLWSAISALVSWIAVVISSAV